MGWIKLHRNITENPMYFSEPFTRMQAWIDLLLVTNYRDSVIYVRGNKVIVKRGQIAKSQDFFATRWRWSRGKVIRFLEELQKCGQIVQQKSRLTTLISVVNYAYYQIDGTTDGQQTDNRQNSITADGQKTIQQTVQQKDSATYSIISSCNRDGQMDGTTDSTTDGQQTVQQTVQPYERSKEGKEYKETSLTRGKEIAEAVASPTSASDEAEASKVEKRDNMPYKEIKGMWNDVCVGYPRLVKLSDSRKNKIQNRVAEMGGMEKALPLLQEIFTKMQASSFMRGDNKRGWKASFDWLFENDKNWVKVYEGNYDNRPDPAPRHRVMDGKNCNDEWL